MSKVNSAAGFAPDAAVTAAVVKTRSPNYPVYKLESALGKIQTLHNAYKRHPMPIGPVLERLGFTANSSSAAQAIAALRAYGLVDVQGNGDGRKVAVTEDAAKILANHPDRPALLRKVALSPKLHHELFTKWSGSEGLPHDDAIKHYLVFDRPDGKFNDDSVETFIRQFRATLAFAKVDSSGNMSGETADDDEAGDGWPEGSAAGSVEMPTPQTQGSAAPLPPSLAAATAVAPPAAVAGQNDFPIYLSNNKRGVLYMPATMTAKDYKLLKQQVDSHLAVIEATAVAEEPPAN